MSKKKQHAPRVPLTVTGGIRAQAGRGHRARHWWGQRWIALLEQIMPGPRLGRGRSYAASGQVAALQWGAGVVQAQVQGASQLPYQIEIRFRTLEPAARQQVLDKLHQRPILAARLLVHELPPEVESLVCEAGGQLFPERAEDLQTDCSCPDWSSFCKHAAAVNFLLAEAIDRDPLLLLALRGIGREELMGGHLPSLSAASPVVAAAAPAVITADPSAFWGALTAVAQDPDPDYGPAPSCAETALLVRRLGPLPFWRGEERFLDVLQAIYARATPRGWAVWSGEPLDLRRAGEEAPAAAGFQLRHRRLNMDLTMR